jgi:DNA-binding CsgD family transcriptional regulator
MNRTFHSIAGDPQRSVYSAGQSLPPNAIALEQVRTLWDTLADFDAVRIDEALTFLLQILCGLAGAQNSEWAGVVRLRDASMEDAENGWRLPVVHTFYPNEKLNSEIKELRLNRTLEPGIVMQSGVFRIYGLRDIELSGWFENGFHKGYYPDSGYGDVLYVIFPVNSDAESCFGIFRACGQPPFTSSDRDVLAYALRGIKWFHRRLLLSHGLLVAGSPLTPVERQVLHGLLSGCPEKEIAIAQGQSYHTTHEYVSSIYRKFGVNNRASLMSIWLGRAS